MGGCNQALVMSMYSIDIILFCSGSWKWNLKFLASEFLRGFRTRNKVINYTDKQSFQRYFVDQTDLALLLFTFVEKGCEVSLHTSLDYRYSIIYCSKARGTGKEWLSFALNVRACFPCTEGWLKRLLESVISDLRFYHDVKKKIVWSKSSLYYMNILRESLHSGHGLWFHHLWSTFLLWRCWSWSLVFIRRWLL